MVFDWVTFGKPMTFWQMLVCLGSTLIGLVEQQTIAHDFQRPADQRPDHRGLPVVRRVPGAGGGRRLYHHGVCLLPGGHGRAETDAADRARENL